MTREEAIKGLKVLAKDFSGYKPNEEMFNMAIKALEQEPCKDAVSRADVVDMLEMFPFTEYSEYETAREVVKRLPSAQPEPQWIPVSERLPEPRVDVWVNSDIGQIQGYYEEHIGIWYASFGQGRDYLELIVTAWMPLPEPYKG